MEKAQNQCEKDLKKWGIEFIADNLAVEYFSSIIVTKLGQKECTKVSDMLNLYARWITIDVVLINGGEIRRDIETLISVDVLGCPTLRQEDLPVKVTPHMSYAHMVSKNDSMPA